MNAIQKKNALIRAIGMAGLWQRIPLYGARSCDEAEAAAAEIQRTCCAQPGATAVIIASLTGRLNACPVMHVADGTALSRTIQTVLRVVATNAVPLASSAAAVDQLDVCFQKIASRLVQLLEVGVRGFKIVAGLPQFFF